MKRKRIADLEYCKSAIETYLETKRKAFYISKCSNNIYEKAKFIKFLPTQTSQFLCYLFQWIITLFNSLSSIFPNFFSLMWSTKVLRKGYKINLASLCFSILLLLLLTLKNSIDDDYPSTQHHPHYVQLKDRMCK